MSQPERKPFKKPDMKVVKKPNYDAIPINNELCETSVLGSMISDQRAYNVAVRILKADDFYFEWNQKLFLALGEMEWPLDELIVVNNLRLKGMLKDLGRDFIANLCGGEFNPANVDGYAQEVLRCSRARKAREAAFRLHSAVEAGDDKAAVRSALVELESIEQSLERDDNPQSELSQQVEDEITGIRTALDIEFCHSMAQTQCFLPGTITLFCGSPGASKSLFCLEMLWRMDLAGIPVSGLMLESRIIMHLRRAIAQYASDSKLTNIKWIKANPDAARGVFARYKDFSDSILSKGVLQAPKDNQRVDGPSLLRWISQEADKGKQLVLIDPITMMETGDNWLQDEANFFKGARGLVDRKQIRLVIVMHPKTEKSGKGQCQPTQDNIQGNPIFRKGCDSAFWLEAHKRHDGIFEDENGSGLLPIEVTKIPYNRTLHVLKARHGPGANKRIGYEMTGHDLRHAERGYIQ